MASRKKTSDENPSSNTVSAISFEDSMKRLSEIVEDLEGGDLSLEESLKRFEEGVKLARQSQERLDTAEARVEQLLGFEENGTAITQDIENEIEPQ